MRRASRTSVSSSPTPATPSSPTPPPPNAAAVAIRRATLALDPVLTVVTIDRHLPVQRGRAAASRPDALVNPENSFTG
ncbi:hypothetical protein GCM10009864_68040 [Streptomyces lunalinharesii]|uniref:Uncharacterized protein n=1 Tax=Streptomyces lunalinharesii TaxID=333384 RepID=A0ABN3SUK3_9ACTN